MEDTLIINPFIREFAELQAKKFGMAPEEYYKKYIEKTLKQVCI